MVEKREYPRIPLELKVTCEASSLSIRPVKGLSSDLSVAGMSFKTGIYEPMSGRVAGSIRLPDGTDAIAFRANLVWRKTEGLDSRCGLQFTGMNDTNRRRLESLIKSVWTQFLTVY